MNHQSKQRSMRSWKRMVAVAAGAAALMATTGGVSIASAASTPHSATRSAVSVAAGAVSNTTLGPTTYQQYSLSGVDWVTVNSAAGTVTIAQSPVLPKGEYVVNVDIQAEAENSSNFLACIMGTTGASDTVRFADGSLGTNTGTEDVGSSNGQVTFNGTAQIKSANDKVVVTCTDGDSIGAQVAGWSITEQPVAKVVVN
jgi:hypothetical protein